jgi:hypothetical protein
MLLLPLAGGCSYGWSTRTNVTSHDFVLVDTSAMPEGSVDARVTSHGGSNLGQVATINVKGPIKIVIVPATRPAAGRAMTLSA